MFTLARFNGSAKDHVTRLLSNNSRLIKLDLSNYYFKRSDAKQLAEALQNNSTVEVLSLRNSEMGDSYFKELELALRHHPSLTELNLDNCKIGDSGVKVLVQILQSNKNLRVLELGHQGENIFSDQGVKELAQVLQFNTSLVRLSLDSKYFGDLGTKEFIHTIKNNHTLVSLALNGSNISESVAKDIAQVLENNFTLADLSVQCRFYYIYFYNTGSINHSHYFKKALNRNLGNYDELETAIKNNDWKIVKRLTQIDISLVSSYTTHGQKALLLAVLHKRAKIARILLQAMRTKGIPINIRDNSGRTAQDLAQGTSLTNLFDVAACYKWMIDTYLSILNDQKSFSLELLDEMFVYADNIFLFRFPYLLACEYRVKNSKDKKAIDNMVIEALRDLANEPIKENGIYAIFSGIILKSALKLGILNSAIKEEIRIIAIKTCTFGDERFTELVKKMEVTKENVQQLKTELNNLKQALDRKEKFDKVFSVAKIALIFCGGQIITELANIAGFPNVIEVCSALFKISREEMTQLVKSGQKLLLDKAAEVVLEKAVIDPNDLIKEWKQANLMLLPFSKGTHSSTKSNEQYDEQWIKFYDDKNFKQMFSELLKNRQANKNKVNPNTALSISFWNQLPAEYFYGTAFILGIALFVKGERLANSHLQVSLVLMAVGLFGIGCIFTNKYRSPKMKFDAELQNSLRSLDMSPHYSRS